MIIDGVKLLLEINNEIRRYEDVFAENVKDVRYEKAEKINAKIEGLKSVKKMVELGDFTVAP